jgi:hypothetical protein
VAQYPSLSSGDNISVSNATVPYVPPAPPAVANGNWAGTNAVVFLWTGIQTTDCPIPGTSNGNGDCALMQPVLQFGPSEAGCPGGNTSAGCPAWGIANWLIAIGQQVYYSELSTVSVNDTLLQSVVEVASDGAEYWVQTLDRTGDQYQGIEISYSNYPQWNQALTGVLEIWNFPQNSSTCTFLPNQGGLEWNEIVLEHNYPSNNIVSGSDWQTQQWYDCGNSGLFCYTGNTCSFSAYAGSNNDESGFNVLFWEP